MSPLTSLATMSAPAMNEGFHFVYPHLLTCLLLLPFLALVLYLDHQARVKGFARFARPQVWRAIAPEFESSARLRKAAILLLALGFAILALARPRWGGKEEITKSNGMDLLFALDLSRSMEVEDIAPNRLKKAKHVLRALAEGLRGDRLGLVAFAGSSFVATPLTADVDYFLETLEGLGVESISNQGTDVGAALQTALASLDRGGELARAGEGFVSGAVGTRAVILVSDGENHEEGARAIAKKFREKGTLLYTLGVGTEKGGPIPVRDSQGSLHGYKREGNDAVLSRFKPDFLSQLAADGDGRYWQITDSESEVGEILQQLGALNRSEKMERRIWIPDERYQIPLGIALLLLLLEMSLASRKMVSRFLIRSLLICALGLGSLVNPALSRAANSNDPSETEEGLRVYRENSAGLQLYKEERFEESKKKFAQAQALNPKSPIPRFNSAVAQLQSGELEAAQKNFEKVAKDSFAQGRPEIEGRALYNEGSAWEKSKQLPQAIQAFVRAIDAAKRAKDPEMEEAARDRLKKLIQQSQSKSKSKSGQGESDQSKGDQEQQQESSNEEKPSDDQKNSQGKSPREYKGGTREEFRSKHLSPEDAEKVLSELSFREKDLQSRVRKQKQGREQKQGKDW